ncbi:MAG: hypothetical protein ABI592_11445 [Acidobacteriota bacterium]
MKLPPPPRRTLLLTVLACAVSGAAGAQQLPVEGCHNAIPCSDVAGHRGFGDQYFGEHSLAPGEGNGFIAVGASFGRGLDLRIHKIPARDGRSRAVEEAARIFVATHRVPARIEPPPPPAPAPAPPAPETPAAPVPKPS